MDFIILKDIVIIFALSTLVNFIFTKLKIPTIVGYLLTGIIAGPHLLGLISVEHNIELMAEIGVILLLFTIGLEFSLQHLFSIRRIVFFGGLFQVFVTAGAFFVVSYFYDMNVQEAVFVGFLTALSSSALVLKILQERSELTSNYGRTVLGILIFQDLLLVPLLLLANLLSSESVDIGREVVIMLIKAVGIIILVFVGNRWFMPRLLRLIALTKNQELFMMSILLICLSVALLTSHLGLSLAFGAFLAGLMVSRSEFSHNAFGNLIPFKDTFTSFFFVSIGMLLDLQFVIDNLWIVLLTVVLVIGVKTIVAGATGFLLGHTFRGTVVVGLALSQVGEFSFLLAKIGFNTNIIGDYFYHLFLAVAVLTMALTPFIMDLSRPFANLLMRLPLPDVLINGMFPLKEAEIPELNNHLVIIGKDPSAMKLSSMAKMNNIPHISIIFDPLLAKEKMEKGDKVIYGDAVNEPILRKAYVDTANVIVISVGSVIPSLAIIDKVRNMNKLGFIIVRSRYTENVEELYKNGADEVFPEKLEIAIDLFSRVLHKKLYSQRDINNIISHIRTLNLGDFSDKDSLNKYSILDELSTFNISAVNIETGSQVDGKTLAQSNLRKITGVTLLALKRGSHVMEHPAPDTVFAGGDIAYIMGNPEQINSASELFSGK
jgi:monovalent cation:H+ antiporter-2, CPA2 family